MTEVQEKQVSLVLRLPWKGFVLQHRWGMMLSNLSENNNPLLWVSADYSSQTEFCPISVNMAQSLRIAEVIWVSSELPRFVRLPLVKIAPIRSRLPERQASYLQ